MDQASSPIFQSILPVLGVIVLMVLGVLANALARRGLRRLAERQYLSEPLSRVFQGLVRWVIAIVVILLSLQQFGVPLFGLWAGLLTVAGMVTIGFIAVWSVLSNILCSVLLIILAPFRIGDEIEIIETTGGKGLRGKVVGLNMMYTSLQEVAESGMSDGTTYVPNNIFFQKAVRQWRGQQTSSLDAALFEMSTAEPETPRP